MTTDALADLVTRVARSGGDWAAWLPASGPHRSGLRLAATDDYDMWLLGWPATTSVSPHDHGESAGAFTVVAGELQEIRWVAGQPLASRVPLGATVTIAPGVVHDVVAGARHAVSIHGYAPPLVKMSYYDPAGSRVTYIEPIDPAASYYDPAGSHITRTEPLDPAALFDKARALHPSVAR